MRARRTREPNVVVNLATTDEVQAYEEHALSVLRNAGYRITMPRVQVIRALGDTTTALSAYAIHEKIVNGGGKIDVVSVYRILTTLEDVGLIHHIGIVNGYYPSKLGQASREQSEVMVDSETKIVKELELPRAVVDAINAQASDFGFIPEQIKVEIKGRLNG